MRRFAALVESDPSDARARMGLGNALFAKGDYARAAAEFEILVGRDARHFGASIMLGSSRYFLGHVEESLPPLRHATKLNPTEAEGFLRLGLSLLEASTVRMGANAQRSDLLKEARESLERACALRPRDANALYYLGLVRERMQDAAAAEEAWRRATELDAAAARPRLQLGILLHRRGALDEAVRWLREAAALAPADPRPHWRLALVHLERREHAEAVAACGRSLALDESFDEARYTLGQALVRAGRAEEGRRVIAEFRERSKTVDRAEDLAARVRSDPSNLAVRCLLARRLAASGEYDRAEMEARRTLARAPDDPDASSILGLLLARAGRFEEAETLLARSVSRRPDDGVAWYGLGVCRVNLGRLAEAREPYEQAVRLRPDDRMARHNLGGVYLAVGELEKAAEAFLAETRLDESSPLPWRALAEAYRRLGRDADRTRAEAEAASREARGAR